jgi:hypothetical protein
MNGKFGRRLSIILGSKVPLGFFLGVLALGLLTNGLSTGITDIFNHTNNLGGWVTAGIGTLLFLLVLVFFDLPAGIRRLFNHPILSTSQPIAHKRGLIALVSQGPTESPQTRDAINYHLGEPDGPVILEHCWLISGPSEESNAFSSQANAQTFHNNYENSVVKVHLVTLNSSEDPEEVYKKVIDIYSEATTKYELSPDEIIADFTAGTKCMTFGMTLACADNGWPMQFMRILRDSDLDSQGRAKEGAINAPVLVNLDFHSLDKRKISK